MVTLTSKQTQALDILENMNNGIDEIVYGGSAGSAKTFIGCYWLLKNALKYPGSRGLLAREEYKTLKQTSLVTFFEVCKLQGLQSDIHYRYREQAGEIHFYNGTIIILKGLPYLPSDPNYDYLGSFEVTYAFIDEIAQIRKKAWDITKTRIRFKLNEYTPCGKLTKDLEVVGRDENGEPEKWRLPNGDFSEGLKPKLFGSLNPSQNYVYTYFYKPWSKGTLEPFRAFIRALPTDNKYLPKPYLNSLNNLPKPERDRLYLGLWESRTDTELVREDAQAELPNNIWVRKPNQHKYIICDVARLGSDKAVIGYWEGLELVEYYEYGKSRLTELKTVVDTLRMKHKVATGNILVDEDGIGGGLVDFLRCKGFLNNGAPLNKENYQNLKTQCYYYLAQHINELKILIEKGVLTEEQWECLNKEIEQIKVEPTDDNKLRIISKEQVKSNIGHSPDMTDMLAMRMWFEINKATGIYHL